MTRAEQRNLEEAVRTNSLSYRAIFAAGFVIFATIAVLAAMLGAQWRSWLPGSEGAGSLTAGVRAAVYTFMSHLQ